MKHIDESIIGKKENNSPLYVVHPGESDLDFYWDLEKTHKFQYPRITHRFGMFIAWHYFVLKPGEFKKFPPRDEATLIYIIDDNIDYKKIKIDLEKGDIPPYMKQVDIKSVL